MYCWAHLPKVKWQWCQAMFVFFFFIFAIFHVCNGHDIAMVTTFYCKMLVEWTAFFKQCKWNLTNDDLEIHVDIFVFGWWSLRVTVIKLTFRHPGRPGDCQIINTNTNNTRCAKLTFVVCWQRHSHGNPKSIMMGVSHSAMFLVSSKFISYFFQHYTLTLNLFTILKPEWNQVG